MYYCVAREGKYRIARNFRGKNFSRISQITGYSRKYYPQMLCKCLVFVDKERAIALICEILYFAYSRNFLPQKFPAIMIQDVVLLLTAVTGNLKLSNGAPGLVCGEPDIAADMALAMVEVGEKEEEEDRTGKLNELDIEEVIPCNPADDEPVEQ